MDLSTVVLGKGSHKSVEYGVCAMELVSYMNNEPFSDSPACVCTVIASMVRRLNDRIPDDVMRTELLKPILSKLIGTAGSKELQIRRGYAAANAAIHEFAPMAFDSSKRSDLAEKLRAAPQIVDKESAITARDIACGVRKEAAAAADAAAADAAYAAYAAAAYAAAAYAAARRTSYELSIKLILDMCEMKDP